MGLCEFHQAECVFDIVLTKAYIFDHQRPPIATHMKHRIQDALSSTPVLHPMGPNLTYWAVECLRCCGWKTASVSVSPFIGISSNRLGILDAIGSFHRAALPMDIQESAPTPSAWGTPATFLGNGCDINSHFVDHQLIFGEYCT
jgi:hypothetical protein